MVDAPADPSAIDDADVPSEAVGTLPAVDLTRVGGPLALVFVAGAAFVLVQQKGWIGPGPSPLSAALILGMLTAVATVLLPAALLVRRPDAPLVYRLLFAGLVLGAAAVVIRSAVRVWVLPGGPEDPVWVILDVVWQGLVALGALLVGLGLLRVRSRPTGRTWLLMAIAVTYVALAYLPTWISVVARSASYTIGYPVALYVMGLLASAFATWVAVGAWLDREASRTFWGLLALALPLTLLAGIVDLIAAVAGISQGPIEFTTPGSVLILALRSSVVVAALVAFGRFTPLEPGSKAAPTAA